MRTARQGPLKRIIGEEWVESPNQAYIPTVPKMRVYRWRLECSHLVSPPPYWDLGDWKPTRTRCEVCYQNQQRR
jgi:hypothetical protein